MRVAAVTRALFQIMHERIDVPLGDIGIGGEVIFRIEKPGFFGDFVVAEKRCHSFPCKDERAPRTAGPVQPVSARARRGYRAH